MKIRHAKRKGDDFERQVAAILSDHLGVRVTRNLLSGPRGEGDLAGLNIHVECKRQERLRLGVWFKKELPKAGGKPFILIHKRTREPILVTMTLNDFIALFRDVICDIDSGGSENC